MIAKFIQKADKKVISLQFVQLVRAGSMFLISIFLTKIFSDVEVISQYESLLMVGSSFTFFWVSALITTFLPHYHHSQNKNEIIYSSFVILSILAFIASLLVFAIGVLAFSSVSTRLWLFYALYILFSSPSFLTEYIWLVRKKYVSIILYAAIIFSLQIIVVILPLYLGQSLLFSIKLLAGLGFIKFLIGFYLARQKNGLRYNQQLVKDHLRKSMPIGLAFLLGGSSEYIDGYLVKYFKPDQFAFFRYGAREFPLTLILANALSNVMGGNIAEAYRNNQLEATLTLLKSSSLRLMHLLVPASIVLLLISPWLFKVVYNEQFIASSVVFNIYLMLVISRLTFPHSIAVGLEKNHLILRYSSISVTINIILSIILINVMGITGVALATLLAHYYYKLSMAFHLNKLGIRYKSYMPLKWIILYSVLVLLAFIAYKLIWS